MHFRIFIIFSSIFWLVSCHSAAPIRQPLITSGPYDHIDWVRGYDDNRFAVLEGVIARSDFEFHLDGDDRLLRMDSKGQSLVLSRTGNVGDGGRHHFSGFVVVQLHKLAQIDDVENKVLLINEFFFTRGAKRVLVTGFRGMGRSIYSDKIKKTDDVSYLTSGHVSNRIASYDVSFRPRLKSALGQ